MTKISKNILKNGFKIQQILNNKFKNKNKFCKNF